MIDETTVAILKILVDRGLVPRNVLRNIVIKKEYEQMKVGKVRSEEAFETLGEKYFLSPKSIQAIVYFKEKKQNESEE